MFSKEQIDFIERELRGRKQLRKIQKRAKREEKRAREVSPDAAAYERAAYRSGGVKKLQFKPLPEVPAEE